MPDVIPAPDAMSRRVALAIWAAWDFPVNIVGEGMAHMVAMLVEGAAESGRVVVRVCVRPDNVVGMRRLLAELRATERTDWTLHVIEDVADKDAAAAPVPECEAAPEEPPLAARLLAMPDRRVGRLLFLAGAASLPLILLRALLRPLWRFAWSHGLRVSMAALRDPVGAAPEITPQLRRLPLPGMRRLGDALLAWSVCRRSAVVDADIPVAQAPPDEEPAIPAAAPPEPVWQVAGIGPGEVDAWLSLMADLVVPRSVEGRRAMLVPDALAMDFSAGWGPGSLSEMGPIRAGYPASMGNASRCDAVLTFSEHVARRHVVDGFGIEAAKIRIVPHAPPDVRHTLPFLQPGRRRSAATRRAAADMLRSHAAARGWDYLAGFPFEHTTYIAVSTQERPSKNLPVVIEALRILVQERWRDLKLLMTTVVTHQADTPHRRLHGLLLEHGLGLDAVSMPRLPTAVHAAFYHAAAVTIHPSFFEGGDAPFPFSESVGVSTPCLVARGPHTEELLARQPDLAPFVFDGYDARSLVDLIEDTVARRDAVLDVQEEIHARLRRRRWADVTEEYAAAATGIPLVPVRRLTPPA